MTKLEWCRANAPEAMRDMDDASILEFMEESWNDYGREKPVSSEALEVQPINRNMDYMVTTLVSQFGNKVAFKGGYMLTKLIPEHARQTTDIDFSIQDSSLYKELIGTMKSIGDKFVSEGIIASYEIKDEVYPNMSGGMKMKDVNGVNILGIDVGWHDITFGTVSTKIDVGDVNAFTVERMLADKVTAILSRKRFRRSKDIYDVYCITNVYSFNAGIVRDFINKRSGGEAAEWDNFPFDETVIREYRKAYDKLNVVSIYTGEPLQKPSYEAVHNRFSVLYTSIREGANKSWNPSKEIFE